LVGHSTIYHTRDEFTHPQDRFMSRDPRNYKNPNKFDPSRFLGENPERDPADFIFGFGRRICPGKFLT
jgi:cytochrome P450